MCKRCAVGHFKEFAGSEQCINKCPAFSSSAEGSTSIADCECDPGYTGVAAEADCKACDVGTYKTERGSAECISCTANSTTLTLASTDPSNCACSVGFSTSHACRILFAEECICTECPVNYYGSHLSLDCLPCPDNTHSLAASTDASMCKCLPGFQQVDTKPNTDIPICAVPCWHVLDGGKLHTVSRAYKQAHWRFERGRVFMCSRIHASRR